MGGRERKKEEEEMKKEEEALFASAEVARARIILVRQLRYKRTRYVLTPSKHAMTSMPMRSTP